MEAQNNFISSETSCKLQPICEEPATELEHQYSIKPILRPEVTKLSPMLNALLYFQITSHRIFITIIIEIEDENKQQLCFPLIFNRLKIDIK